jgi:hypothetical protein
MGLSGRLAIAGPDAGSGPSNPGGVMTTYEKFLRVLEHHTYSMVIKAPAQATEILAEGLRIPEEAIGDDFDLEASSFYIWGVFAWDEKARPAWLPAGWSPRGEAGRTRERERLRVQVQAARPEMTREVDQLVELMGMLRKMGRAEDRPFR